MIWKVVSFDSVVSIQAALPKQQEMVYNGLRTDIAESTHPVEPASSSTQEHLLETGEHSGSSESEGKGDRAMSSLSSVTDVPLLRIESRYLSCCLRCV